MRGGFFRRSRENKGKTNMKQLKFMLAAATAIGLATAAQAAATDVSLPHFPEDFNDYPDTMIGAAITNTTTGITGFSFEGAEGDNESAIIKQAEGDMALQVNTGTDPLLRALDYGATANPIDLADEDAAINYVTIDATVEFTVTPVGDPVTATAGDKLMIFLREVAAAEEGGASTTKLQVKATKYQPAGVDEDEEEIPETNVPDDYDVKYADGTDVAISAKTPYQLTVKTVMFNGEPMFEIYIGGKQIVPVEKLNLDASLAAEANYFPALTAGKNNTTITYVGFAGEGTVDDLVATKNYNAPDSVDFTFVVTWDTGISAVAYTIGSTTTQVPENGTFTVPDGATVELAVTLKDSEWTKLADGTVLKFENVAADKDDINLTTVKIVQKVDPETGSVVVNENATVSEIQESASIKDGYFAGESVTTAELTTVLNWKSKKGGSDYDINNITFAAAGDPETDDAKAYLLDCTKDQLADEIQDFVFTGFDAVNGTFTVGKDKDIANGGKYGNGKVEVRGATALDATDAFTAAKKEGDKFFKAFLVK